MGSLYSLVVGILALAASAYAYSALESYIVSILVAIIVVMTGKSLQPALIVLWDVIDRKFFPLPEVHEFHRKGLNATEDYEVPPEMLGIRVLAMTEELKYNSKSKEAYAEMVRESLEALSKEFPLFKVRLAAVGRRNLPEQYVWSLCGKDGEQMRKCLKAWFRIGTVYQMKARTQNKDLFLHDGVVSVPGKEEGVRYTVMVLFDASLPVTIPKENEEAGKADSDTKA